MEPRSIALATAVLRRLAGDRDSVSISLGLPQLPATVVQWRRGCGGSPALHDDSAAYNGLMADKVSTLLMFGATGDLARRMLLPSLYGLDSDDLLPADLKIIGTARTELDDNAFRERADAALHEHLPDGFYQQVIADRFLARLHYVPLDITQP